MFSLNLRQLRRKRNLTQKQFADAINVSNVTVALWETDKRLPDIITLNKIADFFNVSTDVLLDRTSPLQSSIGVQPIYTDVQQSCIDMLVSLPESLLYRAEIYLKALTDAKNEFILKKPN